MASTPRKVTKLTTTTEGSLILVNVHTAFHVPMSNTKSTEVYSNRMNVVDYLQKGSFE